MSFGLTCFIELDAGDYKKTLKTIHEELTGHILNDAYPGMFVWFNKSFNASEQDSFLGKDQPEKIIAAAANWNTAINKRLDHAYREMMLDMERSGSNAFVSFISENISRGSVWRFKHAFDEATGTFDFGMTQLFCSSYGKWTTIMDAADIKAVAKHPERYAVLTLYYN